MSGGRFDTLAQALRQSYDYKLGINAAGEHALPDRETVARICSAVLALMFPGFFRPEDVSNERISDHLQHGLAELEGSLSAQVVQAVRFDLRARGEQEPPNISARSRELVDNLLADLVMVRELLVSDVEAAFANDPAAANRATIVVSYPCIEALAVQRFAHRLYQRGVPLIPRMMTEVVHSHTGIDIHPGARIGESFFIDHGTGVVIGETCTIGKKCVLYHGVTLGAWNPTGVKDDNGDLKRGAANKRHPDLEDQVTVYPGATILGGDTVIGHHSIIGGNVWLTHSVGPHSVVTIKDPELNIRTKRDQGGS